MMLIPELTLNKYQFDSTCTDAGQIDVTLDLAVALLEFILQSDTN